MRGGGTKGAYETGALKAIINKFKPIEYQYDVVSGVSIGAVNSVMLAIHPKGKERDALEQLDNIWRTHQVQDLFRNWPKYGILGGFFNDAIFDSTPLMKFANDTLHGKPFIRKFTYESVDLNTGRVVNFDEKTSSAEQIQSVLASASIPGFFSPQHLQNMVLADGGIFENLNLGPAIVKCREQGAPDQKIIVDILLCFDQPVKIQEWTYEEAKYKSVSELNMRKKEIKDAYYYLEDIERVLRGFPEINVRYILEPSQKLPSKYIPIFSSLEDTIFQIELGEKDMEALIQSGKKSNNKHIENMLETRNYV